MKIEITQPESFKPIHLGFTIESKRELELFISLLNASGHSMAEFLNDHIPMLHIDDEAPIRKFDGIEPVNILKGKNTWDALVKLYNKA